MAQRIKGQECELMLVVDGVQQDALTDIRNFEVVPLLEIKREGYIGETTERRDEIFNGVRGSFEIHFETAAALDIVFSVINRATRRSPGTTINSKTTLNFPSGEKVRVLLSNMFFGDMPISAPSRSDYLTMKFDFECSDIQRV